MSEHLREKWKYGKSMHQSIRTLLLAVGALIVCAPIAMAVSGSIKSTNELTANLAPVLEGSSGDIFWNIFPLYPTLKHFLNLLFYTPSFFTVFWNSVKMVVMILAGQMVVAVPAAWFFARFDFQGKKMIFTIYVILMLIPFQLTMLPSYLVLDKMGLMGSQWAVILPTIFSTFPVFLIYRGFTAIPEEIMEAARTDGASDFMIFIRIGIPLGSTGILSALVLGFLDYWNMIEQPMSFIRDKADWPLSIYLPEIGTSQAGAALAASVIALIPAAFVFVIGQDYLEQGIIASGVKA